MGSRAPARILQAVGALEAQPGASMTAPTVMEIIASGSAPP